MGWSRVFAVCSVCGVSCSAVSGWQLRWGPVVKVGEG